MSKSKSKSPPVFYWENREKDLEKKERYHTFDLMFYRTNLLVHSNRVPLILEEFLPTAVSVYPNFDVKLARLVSKFHDDYEMVMKRGDVPLLLKLMMNGEEHSLLKQEEIAAARLLSKFYGNPKIEGYQYQDLLMHAILKDCPEAQLHSFCDKLEGYCEALHEVLAGNTVFLEPVINYNAKTFNDLSGNFPLIKEIFKGQQLFNFLAADLKPYFNYGRMGAFLHTPESIMKETRIFHYELWKKITLSMPGGIELLTKNTESHHQ
jgi:hypothetical protein